ncbi:MAG TPA: hypothetical protein PKV71_13725 [Calditrichia bacterium]|nr:hypothetical protein [Calditrichia bacterium]HQV32939.1 hypothetical protein [Calditrichia bacterium]
MVVTICAYCKKPIGLSSWARRLTRMFSTVSHGVCEKCQEIELKKLENRRLSTPLPSVNVASAVSDISR